LTSNRFYIKKIPRESSFILLKGNEHHHLSRVARVKPGESVWLFDEDGSDYLARVEEIRKESTRLLILEKTQKGQGKNPITLAQALIKTKNMELVLQKATELGMSAFVPIISSRSIVRTEDKTEKKMERWRRIALESAKQSGRSFVPKIHLPTDLNAFIKQSREDKKLYFSEKGGKQLKDILICPKPPSSVVLLIGPEGGWTDEEEQDIVDYDFEAVSLGPSILRSETAAIASLALVSHFWNV